MGKEYVILVDEQDNSVGEMEKIAAHQKGELHRAFSVFIFDDNQRLLLQQRAMNKYHSPGLWTNTCCSHPAPGEDTMAAAYRRMKEEMGMEVSLEFVFSFQYHSIFDNGLIEHELDHVFVGYSNDTPLINEKEVQAFEWLSQQEIVKEIRVNPEWYTVWFRMVYEQVFDRWEERFLNKKEGV